MVTRIVSPHIAHASTSEMRCRAKFKYPGDPRAVECDLRSAHVIERADDGGPSWHTNAGRTRVWRRKGYDTEASAAPGTEGQP